MGVARAQGGTAGIREDVGSAKWSGERHRSHEAWEPDLGSLDGGLDTRARGRRGVRVGSRGRRLAVLRRRAAVMGGMDSVRGRGRVFCGRAEEGRGCRWRALRQRTGANGGSDSDGRLMDL